MKIAVTSTGRTMDAQVDPRFGRAACFLIVDTETMKFQVIENSSGDAGGGAGISAAKTVIDAGAKAVLTGNCGPNAERTLRAGNVRLYTGVTGTVAEAVEQLKAGRLTEATGPNVQSHSGMSS
ncbi:MAG TPA: NifB/NifX family molybdenum-iron cluster-binding protein [Sedimentisphaerales bacterium]|nr:NifB/NifX family molybdenum-iron cluster-binding protein [Sedimentisphaerales bacterium]HRS12200.1 NifB/NifX family molybdenum-iron cluster-binding protein [Sedimentisphaerales bacterium]HRV48789.1 NifB/NifX family molybdenum-iron cluster-binding protein [Sedimentisphaerales bacterium]